MKPVVIKISEDQLQKQCVKWFRLQYPQYYWRLFAVPNGGKRNAIEAAKLKQTGTLSGTWDLLLSVPKRGYCGLFLEAKMTTTLSSNQKEFRKAHGNDYAFAVFKTLDTFQKVVTMYLK